MNLRYTSAMTSFCLLLSLGLSPVVAAENAKSIVVGVVHSDAYPSAEMMKRSFEMAVEAKNAAGGVKGKPLKLLFADDGLKTAGAIGYQHGK